MCIIANEIRMSVFAAERVHIRVQNGNLSGSEDYLKDRLSKLRSPVRIMN